jgi:hypothetical protein
VGTENAETTIAKYLNWRNLLLWNRCFCTKIRPEPNNTPADLQLIQMKGGGDETLYNT